MRRKRKLPVVDPKLCMKCGMCVQTCLLGALSESTSGSCAKCIKYCMTMKVPCSPELIAFNYEVCDSCGDCLSSCPHGAIYWVKADQPA